MIAGANTLGVTVTAHPASPVVRHAPSRATVSVTYLRGVLDFAVACGAEAAGVLRRIGLRADDLEDRDHRVPLSSLQALFPAAADALGDPAFALRFGVGVPCTSLTLASTLAAAPPPPDQTDTRLTRRDALDGLNRYAALGVDFAEAAPVARFGFVDDDAGVWLEDHRPTDGAMGPWPELTESVFARFATNIRRRGGESVVRALDVVHAAPTDAAHRAAYDAVFRVPVRFGAPRNALCLDPAFLDAPLDVLPAPVHAVLSRHAEAQLAQLRGPATWRERVAVLIRDHLHRSSALAMPAVDGSLLESVCRELAMSRQTLHRRLREEGTTFLTVRDATLRAMAESFLRDEALPVAVVAARLGFSEAAAFSRAYKRWTGHPPSAVARASTRPHASRVR